MADHAHSAPGAGETVSFTAPTTEPSLYLVGSTGNATTTASTSKGQASTAAADQQGRIMVLMTHNTDISDAFEREGEDPRYFYEFSPNGYALGINIMLYAMTH